MSKNKLTKNKLTKKYIRYKDLKHFKKSEYQEVPGKIMVNYSGTLRKAWLKGVPVYDAWHRLTHTPSIKANPKRK